MDRSAALLRWSPGSVKRATSSVLSYQLARGATVSLVIRDAKGKAIRTAFAGQVAAFRPPDVELGRTRRRPQAWCRQAATLPS